MDLNLLSKEEIDEIVALQHEKEFDLSSTDLVLEKAQALVARLQELKVGFDGKSNTEFKQKRVAYAIRSLLDCSGVHEVVGK